MNSPKNLREKIEEFVIKDIDSLVKSTPSLHFEDGFLIRVDSQGEKLLVLQANKIEDSKRFMVKNHIEGLEVNMSLGYPELSLDFLKEFIFLTKLTVIHQPLKNTSAINLLHNLKELNLDSYFYAPLDFDNFPKLIHTSIYWTPNAKNLFNRTTLNELFISSYKRKDVSEISQLINLESLTILNSPVHDISDLAKLKKLKYLRLGLLMKLTSLKGIEHLTSLESLTITNSRKFKSINELAHLYNLRFLSLSNDGEIESLKPIENLQDLKEFYFYEDTNILNGDLTPLTKIKKLKRASFMNRKHYTHRRDLRTNQIFLIKNHIP